MSATVYRIVWEPGSDRLVGVCHCGAEQTTEDPVRLWEWLLAHPDHLAEAISPAGRHRTEMA